MKYVRQAIEGVFVIEPLRYGDERGYFMETFKYDEFRKAVGDVTFVQDNESMSRRGVLRGLHFQEGDFSQAKLIRVTHGRVLDVVVDLRKRSSTFGRHLAVELSDENALQLFVPRGFAHGFVVLSETARFEYKVDNVYCPRAEVTLKFDDQALGIDWMIPREEMILSPKDAAGLPLERIKPFDM